MVLRLLRAVRAVRTHSASPPLFILTYLLATANAADPSSGPKMRCRQLLLNLLGPPINSSIRQETTPECLGQGTMLELVASLEGERLPVLFSAFTTS